MKVYWQMLSTAVVLFLMAEGFALVSWLANIKNDFTFLGSLLVLFTVLYLAFKALTQLIWRTQWNTFVEFLKDF